MPEEQPRDPIASFLEWLESLIILDWEAIIAMLPLLMVLGVMGPILTLMMLYAGWHFLHRERGRVRIADPEPAVAPVGEDGLPTFPPNQPYCEEHALIYPPGATDCELDRAPLLVRCPVDGTTRPAEQELCRVCGTRYVLGASKTPVVVRRSGRPPQGGAAVA